MNNQNNDIEFLDVPSTDSTNNNVNIEQSSINHLSNNQINTNQNILNVPENQPSTNINSVNTNPVENVSPSYNQQGQINQNNTNSSNSLFTGSIGNSTSVENNTVSNNNLQNNNVEKKNYEEKPTPPTSYVIFYFISIIFKSLAMFCILIAVILLVVGIPLSGLNVNNKITFSDFVPIIILFGAGIVFYVLSKALRSKDSQYNMSKVNGRRDIIIGVLALFNEFKKYTRGRRK